MKPFDSNGTFRTTIPSGGDELRQLAVRGAGMTLLSGGIGVGVQVIATLILARLLTPRDFGLIAMVTTFSLLLVNFGLNGLTEAIVQRDEMTHDLASALFWINLLCGILLTCTFAAIGPLLAWFYHDHQVQQVAVGISLTILATSLAVVPLALLKRAMRFSEVSINDIRARVVSVAVSIVLGWTGYGYWALVAGAVALPMSSAAGAWLLCHWTPGWPRRTAGTGSMLRFAFHTYGNFTVNYFSRNTDNLLVGWRFDAQALGYYKKAYDLFALSASQFATSLTVVVISALSRINRDTEQHRRYLLGAITTMAFIGMGLAAGLTLVGKDLIRVLMGAKWEPAGRIFTFFGPGVGVMMLYSTHGWIHLSIGRADRWFRWGFIEFAVTCLLFFAGLPFGPAGIAMAWTLSFWILTLPAIWYAGKPIGFGVGPVLSAVWRFVLAAIFACSLCALVIQHVPALAGPTTVIAAMQRIVVTTALVGFFYLTAIVILHQGFEPLYGIARLVLDMVPATGRFAFLNRLGRRRRRDRTEVPGYTPEPVHSCPLVSILIPAYNAEDWIADAIRSALAQTWPRLEIIVVDDGSTDRTLAIARQFESREVRVILQKNQGASAARNHAYSLSRGDYIQWLDADDLLAPDKVARQMAVLKDCPSKRILLSSAWGRFIHRPWQAEFVPTALWCDLSPVEWLLRKLGQNIYMQTASWLVSRELTEAAGPWDVRLLGDDDGEYFCRVLLASEGVRFVPQARVYYRAFRFNTLSYVGHSAEKIRAHWLSMQLHVRYLRSLEDTPRVRAACLQYLRDSFICFYPESQDIVRDASLLAAELGEPLGVPRLSWKYWWIERLFGWGLAKEVQVWLRKLRWSLERGFDGILLRIQAPAWTDFTSPTAHPYLGEVTPDPVPAGNVSVGEDR